MELQRPLGPAFSLILVSPMAAAGRATRARREPGRRLAAPPTSQDDAVWGRRPEE